VELISATFIFIEIGKESDSALGILEHSSQSSK